MMIIKWVKRALLGAACLLLLCVSVVVCVTLWEMPPKNERAFMSLLSRCQQAESAARTPEDWAKLQQELLRGAFEVSAQYPGTSGELAALMLADKRAIQQPERKRLSDRLRDRIRSASFEQLVRVSGYGLPSHISADVAAPALWEELQEHLDHPRAAWVAASIASATAAGSEDSQPPELFRLAAKLIDEHYPTNPDIGGFLQTLGNGTFSPVWARQFETLAQRIYEENSNRYVKLSALMACAEIAHNDPARQEPATELYERLVSDFDGTTEYPAQQIEQMMVHFAQDRLAAMRFAALGRNAPELTGVDLHNQPLSLSQYRGKVVLLSFWATWCAPCMKLIPHEIRLKESYHGEPFEVVGVNADSDPQTAIAAAQRLNVSWPSFQDRSVGGTAISERWQALFPTVYLIDHRGIIRYRFSGNPTPQELDRHVQILIAAAKEVQL